MPKKIIVVGSINLDLVASVQRMPREGETVFGGDFATYPGGKGANQAVAAARLGAKVALIGNLGNDGFAEQLRTALVAEGVLTHCVKNVPGPSGAAMILVSAEGHNSIVVIPGANDKLDIENLEDFTEELRDASIILAQLEIPLATVERLAELAAEFNVPFILDPAPARELPNELLRRVTWLTPNESETQTLLASMGITLVEPVDPPVAAHHLLVAGVRNVILKLGAKGVFLAGADVTPSYISSFKVDPIDTTAAGDAFNGGFACALSDGMQPIDAARFANAVAAIAVSRAGAQPSMPLRSEVENLMDKSVTDTSAFTAIIHNQDGET
jgi:ribokinase